ncbi:hypothetical protein [Dyadobacter pollutisoli]|uniref:DUF4421 domain-containing protein n=1 Tax=Dyadobacter pollutisoli TaxID=2910158 RepID=A0A9E8NGX9_9BACT|nr:hypothetical protein [Dyadobacter pollutisoli]WAC14812.1 hypothetical protein ON006_12775 [Dyadobacter pollutisoli]
MKNALLTLLFILSGIASYAQDSIKVSYSQEPDTLVRQRFIDRYENVFMTKVPTRHMFKVGYQGSEVQGMGINFGYEYKLLPSLSFEAALFAQFSEYNEALADHLLHFNWKQVNIWVNAKARWYYNMNRRIKKGLNANNFSGPYIGFTYDQSVFLRYQYTNTNTGRIGLLYGLQSRFFNNGFVDFSVALFNKEAGANSYVEGSPAFWKPKNYVLGTNLNIGLAIGDWKKTKTAPFCDIIFCDELVKGQWKVQMPNISIGLKNQIVRTEVAYERKLGKIPLSMQGDIGFSLYNNNWFRSSPTRSTSVEGNLQLRYYFLRNFKERRGKSTSDLSGPYAGLLGGYNFNFIKSRYKYQPEFNQNIETRIWNTALLLGYQQRLFKRIFFDASLVYRKSFLVDDTYLGRQKPFLTSKMTMGFTF